MTADIGTERNHAQVDIVSELELLAATHGDKAGTIARAIDQIRRLTARIEWQPIETAPRDGSLVILAGGEMQRPIFAWWTSRGYWAGDQRGPYEPVPYAAAFWMPLPAPPTTEPEQ